MRASFALVACLVSTFTGASAHGDENETPRLFDDQAVLAIDLEADWVAVQRDRDGTPEPRPAKLTYAGPSGPVSLPLQIETRGRSRLSRDVCEFAPLRLDFAKDARKGTLFRGIGELKLATHCARSTQNEQFLLLEYLVYRMANVISDQSYRVRLLRVSYRDPGKQKPRIERYGFFIEDAALLAKRLGAERVSEPGIDATLLDPEAASRVELFYYMIGMTDFSMKLNVDGPCCHNVRALRLPTGRVLPIPYDFDQTGVVDPPYALPNEKLGIKRVTQRKFRGLCRPPEETARTLALLQEKRPAITALFESQADLVPARRKKALAFLDGFHHWASDPARVQKTLAEDCRSDSP